LSNTIELIHFNYAKLSILSESVCH